MQQKWVPTYGEWSLACHVSESENVKETTDSAVALQWTMFPWRDTIPQRLAPCALRTGPVNEEIIKHQTTGLTTGTLIL